MIFTIQGVKYYVFHDLWPVWKGNGRVDSTVALTEINRGCEPVRSVAASVRVGDTSDVLEIMADSVQIRAPCDDLIQ